MVNAHPGPLGAQYSPVLEISNVSIHSANDFAATSGVTAGKKEVIIQATLSQKERGNAILTTTSIPKLVESHVLRHLGPHEAGMHQADGYALVLEVEAEQLADHVESCFAGVVPVVAAALALVAQRDAATFAGDQDDLAALGEEVGVGESGDDEGRGDGGGGVHLNLSVVGW